MTNLSTEPTREVHVTDKDSYTREEVARLIKEAIRQTVIEERQYLLDLLLDKRQREDLAAMPPAKYLN
jgi:hypothetical protein